MPVFIDDGYTIDAEAEGVKFTYRPLSRSEIMAHSNRVLAIISRRDKAVENGKEDEAAKEGELLDKLLFATLAKHIKTWDAGRDITPENIAALHPKVLAAIWQVVDEAKMESDAKN